MSVTCCLLSLLFALSPETATEENNLPGIAIIPVFDDQENNFATEELIAAAEELYILSGRFRVVDVSGHELYEWDPTEQALTLQTIAADLAVDQFMLLDVSLSSPSNLGVMGDSLFSAGRSGIDVTGRFYTSSGSLLGSIRENRSGQATGGSSSIDLDQAAETCVRRVVERSLVEIFPYEFTFTAGPGPDVEMPVGTAGGVVPGMVFSLVARSSGIPRSSQEYRALGSHGLMQIMDASPYASTGRLISGKVIEGASITAVENSAPALLSLSYALLPTEVVPGDGLQGEEAETSRLMSQAEFTGATGKWGLALGGSIFSGVVPRMASIGVRGEFGTRIPVTAPSLALRAAVGFEATFLSQNTRADSISSTATTGTIAGTGSLNLEWNFSGRFGLHAGCRGRVGTSADSWTVKNWLGYNRDALPGEVYYAEIKQAPVSFSAGLTYLVF